MEDEDNTEMKKFFNQILYMLKVISVDQYKNDTDIDYKYTRCRRGSKIRRTINYNYIIQITRQKSILILWK